DLEGRAAGAGRAGGHHHRVAAARARRRGARDGGEAGAAGIARPGGPGPGPGPGAGDLPGGAAGLEAVHRVLVGRYHPGRRPGVAGAGTDEIYAAMDWLAGRQDAIEAKLPARHLAPAANPARMALFDLSSSWLEGSQCPLAARGYSRDGKKGRLQVEYGLLTDPAGRPVAVRVFPGNTGDPAAFTEITEVVRDTFGLAQMVMAGDRGMITSARIRALNQREDGTARPDAYGWITALRAPAIRKLMADGGPLQLSLFDEQ